MQEFTGGTVSWDRAKTTFTTKPSNLASSLPGLKVPGQNQPSRPAAAPGGGHKSARHWRLLLIVVPVLLVGLLALFGRRVPRHRRTANGEPAVAQAEREAATTPAYDAVPDAGGQWSQESDSETGASQLTQRYGEPQARPSEQDHPGWTREAGTAAGLGAAGVATAEAFADEVPPDFYQDGRRGERPARSGHGPVLS
jgi:hypothetical protein